MEREVAFRKGKYEFDLEGAHVTVHVPHDIYADDIAGSAAMLAKSSTGSDRSENNAA